MATELIFDTLKLASRLEREAGVDARLASVLSMGLADELGERLATKADLEREIRGVRTALGAQIQSLRSDLDTKTQAARFDLGAEIQGLRAEIRALGWMMKATLAGVAALLAMVIPMFLKTLYGL